MDIASKTVEGVTVVELAGELTTQTAPETQEKVLQLAEASTKMILDMSRVPFMSSAGLRVLLMLHRTITGRGGKVLLVGLSEDLQNTMSLTGFLELFRHSPTLETGLAAL
jgi:anti-sigma B factor antagonist